MSQRTIERKERITTLRKNPNRRILAVLTVFSIIMGIAIIIDFTDKSIASLFPLIIMISLLQIINESILHSEIKPVRHILLLLLYIDVIYVGLDSSDLGLFAPLLHSPDMVLWGILLIRISIMYRKNPFLIRNEGLGKFIVMLNCSAGILFLAAGLGEAGALVGLMRPIQLLDIYAQISGCVAGVITAFSCSLSNRIFLHQTKKGKRVINGGI